MPGWNDDEFWDAVEEAGQAIADGTLEPCDHECNPPFGQRLCHICVADELRYAE